MFKFLIGKVAGAPVVETQRATVERAVAELNTVLDGMSDKPVVGIDLNSGLLRITLPEQMPDEALALPAPDTAADTQDDEKKIADAKAA